MLVGVVTVLQTSDVCRGVVVEIKGAIPAHSRQGVDVSSTIGYNKFDISAFFINVRYVYHI